MSILRIWLVFIFRLSPLGSFMFLSKILRFSPKWCRIPPPPIRPPRNSKRKALEAALKCEDCEDHWWHRKLLKSFGSKWVWVNTYRYIFSGMNIHLPAILGFTRYQGFDPSPNDFPMVQFEQLRRRDREVQSALVPKKRHGGRTGSRLVPGMESLGMCSTNFNLLGLLMLWLAGIPFILVLYGLVPSAKEPSAKTAEASGRKSSTPEPLKSAKQARWEDWVVKVQRLGPLGCGD